MRLAFDGRAIYTSSMRQYQGFCLNCRLLQPRQSAGGLTVYWCPRRNFILGPDFFGRPACGEYPALNKKRAA